MTSIIAAAVPTTPRAALLGCVLLLACACESQRSPDRTQPNDPAKSAAPSLPVLVRDAPPSASPSAAAPDAGTPAAPDAAPPEGMALVPGGPFTMGADHGGEMDEHPAHTVTIPAFYLDLTEVTQEAYLACVDGPEHACAPSKLAFLETFGGAFKGPKRPIVGVSQNDGNVYCAHFGKRLPREAEFEKAVRGEHGLEHPWGNQPPTRELAVFAKDVTEDVASHPAGKGPYGHFDLAGNVWEWLSDAYDPFAYNRPGAATGAVGSCDEIVKFQDELRRSGRQGYTGTNPIPTVCEAAIRGGAYNMGAEALRGSNRVHHPGKFRLQMTGFRCAKDAPGATASRSDDKP